MADPRGPRIYTVGHSTRPLQEFVSLLREHRIRTLIDVSLECMLQDPANLAAAAAAFPCRC